MDTYDIQRATEIQLDYKSEIKYSICTLMTRKDEYQEMVNSFISAGFNLDFTEFLYIDNSVTNNADAYKGLNFFLQKSKGEYIILCHQDILLEYDNIDILEKSISEISNIDPNWAVISNAGASGYKDVVYRITNSEKVLKRRGFPIQKVNSVDENFILVKKSANLSLSNNLNGFHLYGTDLCLIASFLGYNAYVIDFNLLHKSKGKVDSSFYELKEKFKLKYEKIMSGKYIETTCTRFYISGYPQLNKIINSKISFFLILKYISIKQKIGNSKKNIPKSEW